MKEVRLASNLVNLTNHKISLYNDADGNIEDFRPIEKRFWKFLRALSCNSTDDCVDTYYVIKQGSNIMKAKSMFGSNLAVVISEGIGRGGKPIVSLADAEDNDIIIRLRHDSRQKFAYA